MKITMTAKNMQISDSLRVYAEKKAEKLNKFFNESAEVTIRFSAEKSARQIAEFTISDRSLVLRAQEISNDMYQGIDRCIDKIVRQLRKYRTKVEKRVRAIPEVVDIEIPEEETVKTVVRTKRFDVKSMDVQDAIAQMELLGHSFFMFTNTETDSICVVYTRNDGNYGLLMPE